MLIERALVTETSRDGSFERAKIEGGLLVLFTILLSSLITAQETPSDTLLTIEHYLDYETVSKTRPRLVYCSVSGYGQSGPDAGKAAYAPVVHAASGFDHVMAAAQNGDGSPLNAQPISAGSSQAG